MPVESAIGCHITEPRVTRATGALQLKPLSPDAAEFLFQKKHYYCTRLDASYRFLAEGDTCSIARYCAY